APEFDPVQRGQAKARLAVLWERAGQWNRAVAAWQDILDDPALHDSRLHDVNGNPQHATTFASAAIDRLIRVHGPEVYTAIEQRARERFADAKKNHLDQLRRLIRQFPNAAATSTALWELAQAEEEAGHLGAASHAYRTLLRRAPRATEAPLALAALARIYERERLWLLARTTWQQLAATFGELTLPALDAKQSVAEFVASELSTRSKFFQVDEDHRPVVQLPLIRSWELALDAQEKVLLPDGPQARSIPDEWLFFAAPKEMG